MVFFEISASVGDSIVFSSVQYQTKTIIVAQNHLQEEINTIVLHPRVQKLEEVKVSTIELTGNIDRDIGVVELDPFVDNQVLGLPFSDKPQPTVAERRIYTARSGILDLPINYLSGKLKKLKRIKALEDLDAVVQRGEITFNTTFFVDELRLPEDLITDFMYYCAKDEYFIDLLENSKRLTLVEFFQKKVKPYKEHKELD
ncbi:hypothetical protein [Aquimarina aquimarini]|uniref:hypothetical protein n=1 Tax=Aquimarina aquimarini TaxID=1191734 RepID=UPI001F45FF1F|nr:hypothetical protein [Aquimarina aquimarini]